MSASTDIRALLVAASAVTALVGQRVSLTRAEEGAPRPYVVITHIDTERDVGLDSSVGATKDIFQIDCVADSRLKAEQISQAVLTACLAAQRFVNGPTAADVPESGIETDILTVDWWDD